jgi:tetratricopeptide (TPR) repeat protein
MGRAFSEVLNAELTGAAGVSAISPSQIRMNGRALGVRPVSAPGISAERTAAIVAGANRLGYGVYSVGGGRLEATLSIEDPSTGRMTKVVSVSAAANDVTGAASMLAHQISSRPVPYFTRNSQCLKAYAEALESHDSNQASADLDAAIAADPNFGPAYLLLAALKAERQDRAGALATLDQAAARGGAIPPIEQARIQLQAANLRGDLAASQQALASLTKFDPNDAFTWQALGETAKTRHDYAAAAAAYRHAADLQPENVNLLNQLAYASASAGDSVGAAAALRRYRALRPNDPNALDSLGDVNLMAGHLNEAENFYLQAYEKQPDFLANGDLFKAAIAHLMNGDVAGADKLAGQYADARASAHEPYAVFRKPDWLWLTGRRTEAHAAMEGIAKSAEAAGQRPIASRAYAELAVWSLMRENRAAAAQMALKSSSLADARSANDAVIARFLSQPSASPAEWAARADLLAPNPAQRPLRDLSLAYALLLDKKYEAAGEPLRRLYDSGGAGDEGVPVLLAWIMIESGRTDDAAPLLKLNPVPPPNGVSTFMPLYFPRIFDLRVKVAQKAGDQPEAGRNRKLFCKLAPDCS